MSRPNRLLAMVLLGALPSGAAATNLSWISVAGGSASTAANWSPAQLPRTLDQLTFNLAGSRTITWGATVGQTTAHTYRTGTTSLALQSPHFARAAVLTRARELRTARVVKL